MVLEALKDGLDGNRHIRDEVCLAIGKQYGFLETDHDWRETRFCSLYNTIYPAFNRAQEKEKAMEAEKTARLLSAKRQKKVQKLGAIAAVLAVLTVMGALFLKNINDRKQVMEYLQNTYPQLEFTAVKKGGKQPE